MLHFAWPWLALALPLPWLARRLLPPAPDAGGVLFVPFAAALADAGAAPARALGRGWRALALLCWLLLVLAATRPQWLGEPVALPASGRNLMLAVDVSGSMEQTDLDPAGRRTRLDVIKEVARRFIERRVGDRIGLILFGTRAYLQAPLTFDRHAVIELLADAAIGIAGRETAIGDAIGLAIKRLRRVPGESVLILLTDGANTAGRVAPRKAAELARQAGLRIYTIGVGAERMAVPGLFGTQLVNPSADLDEDTLRYIARTTGGRYFRATDRGALAAIYRELDRLEPVAAEARTVRPVDELFLWPLGLALALSVGLALGTAGRRTA